MSRFFLHDISCKRVALQKKGTTSEDCNATVRRCNISKATILLSVMLLYWKPKVVNCKARLVFFPMQPSFHVIFHLILHYWSILSYSILLNSTLQALQPKHCRRWRRRIWQKGPSESRLDFMFEIQVRFSGFCGCL